MAKYKYYDISPAQALAIAEAGGGGGGGGGAVSSVAGKTGAVTLVKGDVGLGNVDNTPDASKPVSTAQNAAISAAQSAAIAGAPVQSVAGRTGAVALAKADVGLANVDNTSDVNKPISTAQQTALDAKVAVAAQGAASGIATLDASSVVVQNPKVHAARHASGGADPLAFSTLQGVSVGGVTDGQLLSFNATSGFWTPVAPSGNNEMAYAANTTGTATAVTGGNGSFVYVDIPNCTVTVTNSAGRPVWLSSYAMMQQTVTGAGMAVLNIVETTSGAVNLFSGAGTPLPNSVAAVMKNSDLSTKPYRIGAVTTTRTFKLQLGIFGSGVAPAGQVVNSAALPSWLLAEIK